jgi:hypothetical protein
MHIAWQVRNVVVLATFAIAIAFSKELPAQGPLRWKFQEGDTLGYDIIDEMTLDTSNGATEAPKVTIRQEMNLVWIVESVAENGDAVIQQKIDDVKFKLSGPDGARIEYESSGDEETTNLAAMVAPIYDAITADNVTFTMDNRGTIKEVKVSDKVIRALKNSPRSAALGEKATPEGLQRLMMKWTLVLPEKTPTEGETWSTSEELESPLGGKKTIRSTYVYKGAKEMDGKPYVVFEPGLELAFEDANQAHTKIVEQNSSGEILFDQATGRIHSSKIVRDISMDVTVEGHTERQKIAQTIEVHQTKED